MPMCESFYRKVGLLRIQGKNFDLQPLPLKTVRPFKMEDVVLADEAELEENELDLDKRDTITAFLAKKVKWFSFSLGFSGSKACVKTSANWIRVL